MVRCFPKALQRVYLPSYIICINRNRRIKRGSPMITRRLSARRIADQTAHNIVHSQFHTYDTPMSPSGVNWVMHVYHQKIIKICIPMFSVFKSIHLFYKYVQNYKFRTSILLFCMLINKWNKWLSDIFMSEELSEDL